MAGCPAQSIGLSTSPFPSQSTPQLIGLLPTILYTLTLQTPPQPLPDSIYTQYLFSFQKGILNLCITLSFHPPLPLSTPKNKQSSKCLQTLFLWTWRWSLDHTDTVTEGQTTPWVIQAKRMLSTGKNCSTATREVVSLLLPSGRQDMQHSQELRERAKAWNTGDVSKKLCLKNLLLQKGTGPQGYMLKLLAAMLQNY